MANDKVLSIRADEETIERLNALADQSGMKKAEILPALISAYEADRVRDAIPERAADLDNMRSLMQQIEHAFVASFEFAANTEARVRLEFQNRIESNEQAIASLKEATAKSKEEASTAKIEAAAMAEARDRLADELSKAQELIQTKTESIDGLKAAKESMEHRVIELEAKLTEIPDVEKRAKAAEAKVESLKRQMADSEQEYQKKLWQLRDTETSAREQLRSRLIKKLDEASDRYNTMQKQLTDALAKERARANEAEVKAREKMEAVLDKAEQRHEAEMSRLLDRIDRTRQEEKKAEQADDGEDTDLA